jgi:hypothetical protein
MVNDESGVYRIIINYSLYQSYNNPEYIGIFLGFSITSFLPFLKVTKVPTIIRYSI